MKKIVLSWIVLQALFFAILWICLANGDSGLDDLVKTVQPATVKIYVFDQAGNPVSQGSGFFFNPMDI